MTDTTALQARLQKLYDESTPEEQLILENVLARASGGGAEVEGFTVVRKGGSWWGSALGGVLTPPTTQTPEQRASSSLPPSQRP